MSLVKVSVAVLAASAAFAPAAAAQDQPPAPAEATQPDDEMASETRINSHITVYGAARDRSKAEAAVAEDESVPELPVVYEDDVEVTAPAGAAPPASPAR